MSQAHGPGRTCVVLLAIGSTLALYNAASGDIPAHLVEPVPIAPADRVPGQPLDGPEEADPGRDGQAPSDELLAAIAWWLSANFDLATTDEFPDVRFASRGELAALRSGASHADQSSTDHRTDGEAQSSEHGEHDILGLYIDASRTIYLQTGWTGATSAEMSVLVHEMVHYLQDMAGLEYDCAEARERVAYAAQRKWLEEAGLSLDGEFSIDAMTLLIRTSCPM